MNTSWPRTLDLALLAARYRSGAILLSGAAREAGVTPLEFMEYLASIGQVSPYSMKDFDEAQAMLDEFLDYKPPTRPAMKSFRKKR